MVGRDDYTKAFIKLGTLEIEFYDAILDDNSIEARCKIKQSK